MAARITRAEKKIALARIPYRVPSAGQLPRRVEAAIAAVHAESPSWEDTDWAAIVAL